MLPLAAAVLSAHGAFALQPRRTVAPITDSSSAEQALRELESDQSRHAADLAEMEGLLNELLAVGHSTQAVSDPSGVLARRNDVARRMSVFFKDGQELEGRERDLSEAVKFALVRGLPDSPPAMTERLLGQLNRLDIRREALSGRGDDLIKTLSKDDQEVVIPLELAAAKQERPAGSHRVPLWVLGGGAVLAALVWRRVPLRRTPRLGGPPAPLLVAGSYELGRLIGRGGLGELHEAFDRSLQRRAAVRRLSPELLADPREAERLLSAARAAASIKHPHVVELHAVERDAAGVWLVFEFVDGDTLERTLAKTGRMVLEQARRVLGQASEAVDAAHARGVIHRDLRPANIMLTRAGDVKVTDFGFASEARRTMARLTRAQSWGTPAYMSPEQELGETAPSVDTWALAVCFYEMLTGEVPFKGPDFLTQKREGLYAPPCRLVAGLPAGMDELFRGAFAPDSARRFTSPGALARAASRP